ncbi:MAG: hypothetical protein RL757_1097 [Bacteroidota bacterium]|jgi:hypothetical protein
MILKVIKYQWIAAFGLLMSVSACTSNWFTPVVDVEVPAHVPKLVVYANWQTNEDSMIVFVSQSRGSLDSSFYDVDSVIANAGRNNTSFKYDTVAGAKVDLYKNDVLVMTIPSIGKGIFAKFGRNLTDSVGGSTYKLVVSAPGFTTIEAVQPLYSRPVVKSFFFATDGAFYTDPNAVIPTSPQKGDAIDIEFQDPAGEVNFYDVLSMTFERDSAGGIFYSRTFIPRSIDATSIADVLGDATFNGKTYKWQLWASSRDYNFGGRGGPGGGGGQPQFIPRSGDRIKFTFRTFNRDWQLFKKSRALLQQAQNNLFFTEPVQLHTNIQNGYGIFFLNSERTLTVRIP